MNTNIILQQSVIIVGFSGGPDSLYLLEQLFKLRDSHNITLIAAHLDHEWRANSSEDVAWCRAYCEKKEIPFVTKKISELNIINPKTGSKEAAARAYRRAFLESIAEQYQNSCIALGHHLDDQIETFFIRLARGTTLAGIGCMKEQDGLYIRPLLSLTKETILENLAHNNIPFLIDSTNADTTILRNHIRAKILPQLKTIDSRFINNIKSTINSLQDSYQAFESMTQKLYQGMLANELVNTEQFLSQSNISIQQEIISKILILNDCKITQSKSFFNEIIRFLKNGTQKEHFVHPTCMVIKNKTCFTIINPTKNKAVF